MIKSFLIGIVVGILLLSGSVYYYFDSGMAPVATSDPPMPFEHMMARKALSAHIDEQKIPAPPIPADEPNLVAGAKVYKDHCAECHGLPNQPSPVISDIMFPHAPMLFKGHGVTDDPPQESYWKAQNGIRLSGMPGFKKALSDTQLWQVALLVANADKLPDSAKAVLVPEPAPAAPAAPVAMNKTKKKK
ncbi:MAG TPA: cytochrome c [Candidatus Dormibacteraeota bacterium]|nr:cytochrome c [Candidatus Dormibacteraeota bacterium]